MTGWVKIYRSIQDNDLWLAEPFTWAQAWIDLLLNANHKAASFWVRKVEIKLKRGQLGWSEITMSERWKWSRGKVRRYLGMLETRGMIEQQKTQLTSVITICNYDDYQEASNPELSKTVQQTEHQTEHQTDSRRYTNKNDKNEKKKNIDHQSGDLGVSGWFEILWQNYASLTGGKKKIGAKQPAFQSWQRLTKGHSEAKLRYQVNVCLAYHEMRRADPTIFGTAQNCVSYLNQKVWLSDDEWLNDFNQQYQHQLENEKQSGAENGSIN